MNAQHLKQLALALISLLPSAGFAGHEALILDEPTLLEIPAGDETVKYLSYTSIPFHYKDWPSFAEQLNAPYTEKEKRLGEIGSSACAHSPACVIVLPIMLVQAIELLATKERRLEISYTHEDSQVEVNYHKASGTFLYAKLRDPDEYLHKDYIKSLGIGYLYFDRHRDQIINEVANLAEQALNKAQPEEYKRILEDIDQSFRASLTTILYDNRLRGPARASLIQRHCYSLFGAYTENQYLKRIVHNMDAEAESALIECATNVDHLRVTDEQHQIMQPYWQKNWLKFCKNNPPNNLASLEKAHAFIKGAESLKLDLDECNSEAWGLLERFIKRDQLTRDEWQALRAEPELANFVASHETNTQRGEIENIVSKLITLLAGGRNDVYDTELEYAFSANKPEINQLLLTLFLADLSDNVKLPLFPPSDPDISRQTALLKYFSNASSTQKVAWQSQLNEIPEQDWKRSHLSLAMAIRMPLSDSRLKPLLQHKGEVKLPVEHIDISSTPDELGPPVEQVYWAMQEAGFAAQAIADMEKAYRIEKPSLLDRTIKLIP